MFLNNSSAQSQKAVSAYFICKQILPSGLLCRIELADTAKKIKISNKSEFHNVALL